MIRPIPFHGETGQREAEEGCPTIPKKNHGRLTPTKIVGKKSEQRASASEEKETTTAKRQGYEDILWALINTKEFLFNH